MNQDAFQQDVSNLSVGKEEASSRDRLFCLDLLKAISIIAVVSYHAVFVPRSTHFDSLGFLDITAAPLRFCVPVFFTISFLLLEKGMERSVNQSGWQILQKRMTRLAIPTLFWFGLAIVLKLSTGGTLPALLQAAVNGNIFQGAYYLLVLFQLIPLSILFRRQFKHSKAVGLAILLQCFIFLAVDFVLIHANQFPGILAVLKTVNRPLLLYWFGYAALGIYCWQHWSEIVGKSRRIAVSTKLFLLGTSFLLMMVDRSLLFTISQGNIPPFDYNMLSCILITPILLLSAASIQKEDLPPAVSRFILLASRYSLGIFCINGIMSEVFLSLGTRLANGMTFSLIEILFIKLAGWIVLFFLALKLSVLLDRIGLGAVVR